MTATAVCDAAPLTRTGERLRPAGPVGFARLRAGTSVGHVFVREVSGGDMDAVWGRCESRRAQRRRPSTSRSTALAPV
jgi:class 3 adenylate cyclase